MAKCNPNPKSLVARSCHRRCWQEVGREADKNKHTLCFKASVIDPRLSNLRGMQVGSNLHMPPPHLKSPSEPKPSPLLKRSCAHGAARPCRPTCTGRVRIDRLRVPNSKELASLENLQYFRQSLRNRSRVHMSVFLHDLQQGYGWASLVMAPKPTAHPHPSSSSSSRSRPSASHSCSNARTSTSPSSCSRSSARPGPSSCSRSSHKTADVRNDQEFQRLGPVKSERCCGPFHQCNVLRCCSLHRSNVRRCGIFFCGTTGGHRAQP